MGRGETSAARRPRPTATPAPPRSGRPARGGGPGRSMRWPSRRPLQLGSAFDKLADSGVSSASGILNVVQRISGTAVASKISAQEASALAAALLDTPARHRHARRARGDLADAAHRRPERHRGPRQLRQGARHRGGRIRRQGEKLPHPGRPGVSRGAQSARRRRAGRGAEGHRRRGRAGRRRDPEAGRPTPCPVIERPLGHATHAGLLLVDRQLEPGHHPPHRGHRLGGVAPTADHEVVGVVDDRGREPALVPQGLPAAHETTHVDVRQKRGQGRPLRASPALVLVAGRPVMTPPPSTSSTGHSSHITS
jgi:hypothetical protein